MQQVLLNLVLNAVDAVEEKGSIQITGEKNDEQIIIKVIDSGKGIPPEHLTDIFKPFYTDKEKGTGLGLAIVKRIVESGDGIISAESSKEKGTSFIITFNQGE